MSNDHRFSKLLRWYPSAWRARYGDEMTALLKDTYGTNRVPRRDRLSLTKAGSVERARSAGLLGDAVGPDERVRAGSLLILCAWALFMVAVAIVAKFSDNWIGMTPTLHRSLPRDGFTAAMWAGALGGVLVLAAACVVLPAFVRFIRHHGWASIRRTLRRATLVVVMGVALTVGLSVWAHHLSPQERNGGTIPYELAFLLWSVVVVAAIAMSTAAAVSVARRLTLSRRTLQVLGSMALALALTMGVVIVGFATWWSEMATYAPRVLSNGIGNGIPFTSSTFPPTLVIAGILMLIGVALATLGTLRVTRSH
jgi:hypothetical protein